MWSTLLSIALTLLGFFMMFIILLQRGRGGGLAGAFGGLGGQSAFGTKAGDVFTKITVVVAVFWVALAGVTGIAMWSESEGKYKGGSDAQPEISAPENGGDEELPPSNTDSGASGSGLDLGIFDESDDSAKPDDNADDSDPPATDASKDN